MLILESPLDMTSVTVADIALKIPQAIDVLNRYNLDYCCNGKKNFVVVCRETRLDPVSVWNEIIEKINLPANDARMKFENWEPALLIDFIVQHHHSYVREAIPHLKELLGKVCTVHASDTPELLELQAVFNRVADELLDHMPKEEVVLFPAIRQITEIGKNVKGSATISVKAPIAAMEYEHETVGDLVKQIRKITNSYTAPIHACPTFQLTYKLLKEFDNDLMQHIHLENNVLFPKVKPAK